MQDLIDDKSKIFSKNTIIYLGVIALVSFLIRLFYFPEGIPITLDGTLYFWYANDLSVSGTFPTNVDLTNNGWPTFLSVFFYFFNSENFLEYMDLQRYITIIVSVATIIPVFILCRKFCGNKLSLFGASLFAFQPRIIENSLLGVTEPLFILLELSCLVLFLQNDLKFKYLSFAFLALACLVRYEGILLIIPLSILFILQYRKKKIILKYSIAISIFLLILLPMAFVKMDTMGYDGIVSHSVAAGIKFGQPDYVSDFPVYLGAISFIKSIALAVFPIFFIFLPLGLFAFFRKRNFDKSVILSFLIFMSLPIIYVASRDISDPRYLLTLFPIFSIISVYTVREIIKKFDKTKLISVLFIIAIIVLSIIYLDYNKNDYEHELEVYNVGLEVHKRTSVINDYHPESKYVHNKIDVAANLESFPILSSELKQKVKLVALHECIRTDLFCFNSLDEFIDYGKNEGLTHIVTDHNENRPQFLKDVFYNEEKFPYLIKIYDSSKQGYDYHLKIFKIDYEIFDSIK